MMSTVGMIHLQIIQKLKMAAWFYRVIPAKKCFCWKL